MTTGERIRARRKELGITVDNLADKVKIHRTTIIRYENGYTKKMSIGILVLIAHALNTTIAYLMGWEGEKQPASGNKDELENEFMQCFHSLSKAQKMESLNYLRYLSEK